MIEPQLGFGLPYVVAGYSAALLILASAAAASKSLAPAVASICLYMIICNTCASIVCFDSLSARILAGSNPSAAISASCLTNYASITNTATSILTTPRTLVVNHKCYGKNSTDTTKKPAPHLAPL